jgi:hypothetical protein
MTKRENIVIPEVFRKSSSLTSSTIGVTGPDDPQILGVVSAMLANRVRNRVACSNEENTGQL